MIFSISVKAFQNICMHKKRTFGIPLDITRNVAFFFSLALPVFYPCKKPQNRGKLKFACNPQRKCSIEVLKQSETFLVVSQSCIESSIESLILNLIELWEIQVVFYDVRGHTWRISHIKLFSKVSCFPDFYSSTFFFASDFRPQSDLVDHPSKNIIRW